MSISSPTQKKEQGQIYQNFIGGEWRNSRSGETFTSTNPAHTSEVIGHYQKSTAADLEDAIDAAVKAQPGWAATPAPERGEIMLRAALLLEHVRADHRSGKVLSTDHRQDSLGERRVVRQHRFDGIVFELCDGRDHISIRGLRCLTEDESRRGSCDRQRQGARDK